MIGDTGVDPLFGQLETLWRTGGGGGFAFSVLTVPTWIEPWPLELVRQ